MKTSNYGIIRHKYFKSIRVLLTCILGTVIILTGCKKDISSPLNEVSPTSTSKIYEKAPDIIVHAGQSIQAAVNAASPGSIIQIEPGVYNESIVVNKANLQLIGNAAGVIIQTPPHPTSSIRPLGTRS